MDYLDRPKQQRQHALLYIGYVLVAIAITIATLILVYQAYGFGIGKNGAVIQNDLIFFSSHPNPADIYVDGQRRAEQTNSRLVLPAGIYDIKLTRDGYRDWQRTIELQGGNVEHFDYPFLFPTNLVTQKTQGYTAEPALLTQSPDRRWLLVQAGAFADFNLVDLKDPVKPVITTLTVPENILAKATASQSWQLVEWSDDNRHVLLRHTYDNTYEYILVDRSEPVQSLNLTSKLELHQAVVSLRDKNYDEYYVYDAASGELRTAELGTATAEPLLQNVLAYKPYGSNTMVYVTDDEADDGKVLVKMKTGNNPAITIRSLAVGKGYLLDLAEYDGKSYLVAGTTSGDKVYIYKDPAGQVSRHPGLSPSPVQVLHVNQPNYLSFSNSAQFVVVENGQHFGVYDIENEVGYNYAARLPLDAPQTHASWMDGNRLVFVSGGKLSVIDYDNTNQQQLMPAGSNLPVAFAPNYKYVFAIAPVSGGFDLNRTALVTPNDE
jgi:hypothetical protein